MPPILLMDQRWESSIELKADLAATLNETDVDASRTETYSSKHKARSSHESQEEKTQK